MARLAGTNVLTINTDETDLTGTSAPVAMANVQKTVVKLGTNFSGLTLTTILMAYIWYSTRPRQEIRKSNKMVYMLWQT